MIKDDSREGGNGASRDKLNVANVGRLSIPF